MLKALRNSLIVLALTVLLVGFAFPALVTFAAGRLFPAESRGSLVMKDGAPVGSALIAQDWTFARYIQGRASANEGGANNAMISGAGNAGPASIELYETTGERAKDLRKANPDAPEAVPQDLATTSGSGLDPHVTPEAALWQAPRVAKIRSVKTEDVERLIRENTEKPFLGFLGEPRVNVLRLNMELDRLYPVKAVPVKKKAPSKPKKRYRKRKQ